MSLENNENLHTIFMDLIKMIFIVENVSNCIFKNIK